MVNSIAEAFDAIASNDVAAVKEYVVSNPQVINAKTFFVGGTLLHYAAAKSSPDMIRMLVALGFEVNREGEPYGNMPLDSACTNNKYENAEALLLLGARLDVSKSFRNPLFGAIVGSAPRIVRLLLNSGVDPSVEYRLEDGSVTDAIAFARKRGEVECEKVLMEFAR